MHELELSSLNSFFVCLCHSHDENAEKREKLGAREATRIEEHQVGYTLFGDGLLGARHENDGSFTFTCVCRGHEHRLSTIARKAICSNKVI